MGFFDLFKKKSASVQQELEQLKPIAKDESRYHPTIKEMTVDQVIIELEKLDYFAYTDPADRDQVKDELGKGLSEEHYFPFIEVGSPRYKGIDARQYNLNNETLFEEGGILEALTEMLPLFSKQSSSPQNSIQWFAHL